jgi:D-alanine-D-alanine ligase
VQGALELLGIPYTGSGVMASAIAIDKVMTKRVWIAEGLPTPRYVRLAADQQDREQLRAVPDVLGLPLVVKPPREGSSIGITKVEGYSQMQGAVALAARFDSDVLCEQFIEGDEVTCPVLGEGEGARALPVVRIVAPDGQYDYQNKYFTDVVRYECPSGRPPTRSADPAHRPAAYRTSSRGQMSRPDAQAERPQALPARDEHLARNDVALAGADVGARRRHQLPGAVRAAAGERLARFGAACARGALTRWRSEARTQATRRCCRSTCA